MESKGPKLNAPDPTVPCQDGQRCRGAKSSSFHMNIIELLDRPIAFHRCLVDITGSVPGALMLSQAIYWQNRPTRESKDGWWYKTYEDWKEETGLSRRDFDTARRSCSGLLLHKLKGVPAKTWYKVDEQKLKTSLYEVCKLDYTEPANQFAQGVQTICTETNTETNPVQKRDLSKGSLEEVKEYCLEQGLPDSDGEWFFYKCQGCGWTNGGKPIRDWQATIRAWKTAGYLPSQKHSLHKHSQYPFKPPYKTIVDDAQSVIENFKMPDTGLNEP